MNLFYSGRPTQNALHLLHCFRWRTARLRDMRLLREVLRNQLLRGLHGAVVIMIYRAHDQLRTIYVCQSAPGFFRANFNVLQGFVIICWRHAIIERHAIGDFARQFHHTHMRRANVDRHVARFATPVYDI